MQYVPIIYSVTERNIDMLRELRMFLFFLFYMYNNIITCIRHAT